jgi:hypothetical protein
MLENMSPIMGTIRLKPEPWTMFVQSFKKKIFLLRCKQQPDMELWIERCDRKKRMGTHVLTRCYQKLVTFLSWMSSATSNNIDEKRINLCNIHLTATNSLFFSFLSLRKDKIREIERNKKKNDNRIFPLEWYNCRDWVSKHELWLSTL